MNPTKVKALERLQAALIEIPNLQTLETQSPKFRKWKRDTEVAIGNTFGDNTRHLTDFTSVHFHAGIAGASLSRRREAYTKGLASAASVLESMIDEIREYWPTDDRQTPSATGSQRARPTNRHDAFLVHGRDEGAKQTVARFLEQLKLKPIVLAEQPSQGLTIIEKFEKHAHGHCMFGVLALTVDQLVRLVT